MKTYYVDIDGSRENFRGIPVEAETPQQAIESVFDNDHWPDYESELYADNEVSEYRVYEESQEVDDTEPVFTLTDPDFLLKQHARELLDALELARAQVYALAQELAPTQAGMFDAIWSKGGPIGAAIAKAKGA